MAENNLVQIQQIGISTANLATFTGKDRVLVVNTDTHRLHVQDGKTAGGLAVPLMSDLKVPDADEIMLADGTSIQDAIDKLNYKAINITAFTNNVNTVEMGSTVSAITFNWSVNKKPTKLEFDGESIDTTLTTKALTAQSITANKSFTLKATDEKGAVSTKTTGVTFMNGLYYGVGTVEAEGVTNEFVQGLTKNLATGKGKTFTVNAASGQYIYYCIPARFGKPSFKVGGFEGGFELLKTFDYTNASGYTESYYVYRSSNASLGNTTVVAA